MTMTADPAPTDPATDDDLSDRLYLQAREQFAPAIARVAGGYERDTDKRRDLIQDIHVALWRSFATYEARCALGTWVYRVAHNVAAAHVAKASRTGTLIDIEDMAESPADDSHEDAVAQNQGLSRLQSLIHRLAPTDRQIILLYLEGLAAQDIADVTGLSPSNIAVKIHRIKAALAQQIAAGDPS